MRRKVSNWVSQTLRSIANRFCGVLDRVGVRVAPPDRFVAKTHEWLESNSVYARDSRRNELYPAYRSVRKRPINGGDRLPWPFLMYYGGEKVLDEASWVVEIPGGRVAGKCGVITPDNCFLADVSRELIVGGDQSKHSILRKSKLPPIKKLSGTVAVLSVTNVTYWHWLFDLLPRVLLLEQDQGSFEGIDAFIVNERKKPYHNETLEKLGVPAEKIIESRNSRFHIQAERLLVPSVFREVPARWACRSLREKFLGRHGDRLGRRRRVYISRADAETRRIRNEEALMKRLSSLGFESVTLTGLSFQEQLKLFSSAEFVVAPHGAGLANIVFCSQRTSVVEIFPPTYVNPTYWVLSDHLDLDYYYVMGSGEMPTEPPPDTDYDSWFHSFVDSDRVNGRDITVNVDEVATVVESAIGERTVKNAGMGGIR